MFQAPAFLRSLLMFTVITLPVVTAAGCETSSPEPSPTAEPAAAPEGEPDASPEVAPAVEPDAGEPDAGEPDASPSVDPSDGGVDGGVVDAGNDAVDAGASDAGVADDVDAGDTIDVDAGPDSCEGVSAQGQCDQDVLRKCVDGVLIAVPCLNEGLVCGAVNDDFGYGCVVPTFGTCVEPAGTQSIVRECLDGHACVTNSDVTAHQCVPGFGPDCSQASFEGRCEGDTVVYDCTPYGTELAYECPTLAPCSDGKCRDVRVGAFCDDVAVGCGDGMDCVDNACAEVVVEPDVPPPADGHLWDFETWVDGLPEDFHTPTASIAITRETQLVAGGASAARLTWTSTENRDVSSRTFIPIDAGQTAHCDVEFYDDDAGGRMRLYIQFDSNRRVFPDGYSFDSAGFEFFVVDGVAEAGETSFTCKIRLYDDPDFWDGEASIVVDNMFASVE